MRTEIRYVGHEYSFKVSIRASEFRKNFLRILQDFEVWDDVGLNIPKPPELLNLYREIMKYGYLNAASQSVSTQTDGDIEEVELLVSCKNLNFCRRICNP